MPNIVTHFQDTDVLLGRTKQCRGHPGNAKFRSMLDEFGAKYHLLTSRSGRSQLVDEVETCVAEEGWRFLKFESGLGVWREATKKEIREKISHGFRDRKRQSISTIASKGSDSSRIGSRSSSPKLQSENADSENRTKSKIKNASNKRERTPMMCSSGLGKEPKLGHPSKMKDLDSVPFNLAECLLSLRSPHRPPRVTVNHQEQPMSPNTRPNILSTTNVSIVPKQDGVELDKIKELRRLLSKRSPGALERARVCVSPPVCADKSTDGSATPKIRNTLKHDRMQGSIESPIFTAKRRRLSVTASKFGGSQESLRCSSLVDQLSTMYPDKLVLRSGPRSTAVVRPHRNNIVAYRRCPPTAMSRLPFKKRHFVLSVPV